MTSLTGETSDSLSAGGGHGGAFFLAHGGDTRGGLSAGRGHGVAFHLVEDMGWPFSMGHGGGFSAGGRDGVAFQQGVGRTCGLSAESWWPFSRGQQQ